MNKFMKMLTNSSDNIKNTRAKILESSVKGAFDMEINGINYLLSEKRMELERLTDIAPENTYTLKPGGPGFNPNDWVKSLIKLENEIYTLNIKLDIATKAREEWVINDEKGENNE